MDLATALIGISWERPAGVVDSEDWLVWMCRALGYRVVSSCLMPGCGEIQAEEGCFQSRVQGKWRRHGSGWTVGTSAACPRLGLSHLGEMAG